MELTSVGWDDLTVTRVLVGATIWALCSLLAGYWAVTQLGAVQAVLALVAQRAIRRFEAAGAGPDSPGGGGSSGVDSSTGARATCRRTPTGELHLPPAALHTPGGLTMHGCGLLSFMYRASAPEAAALSAGIEVAGLRLDIERHVEAALARAFFTVREASVGALSLDLPTWRAPLVLRASRIRLVLQQRNMPEVSLKGLDPRV
jgi:hypothetical protein